MPLTALTSVESGDTIDVTYGDNTIKVTYDNDLSDSASVAFDRAEAPANAVVYLTIADTRLNQDPTGEDTWILTVNTAHADLDNDHGLLTLDLDDFTITEATDQRKHRGDANHIYGDRCRHRRIPRR